MYIKKNLFAGEFGSMFFTVSATLSKQGKKMKYTDWMALRDIAIGNHICDDCRREKVSRYGELLAEVKYDLIILADSCGLVEIRCGNCRKMLKSITHEPTALQIIEYFEMEEKSRVSPSGLVSTDRLVINSKDERVTISDSGVSVSKKKENVDKDKEKSYNNNIIKNNENKKENENMMNTNKMFKGLDFGKANKDLYRLSHLGLAIKNTEGTFVSYDKTNQQLVDVDLFDFDLDGMIYKMPVAHNQVAVGDVIVHNNTSMIVQDLKGNNLEVIDPCAGEVKTIMPTKNMFGFNFFTKILCLMDMSNLGASNDNPFGNMMPMLMMSAMGDGKGDNDMMTMMMMFQMMGGNQMGDMFSNPMMMMAMMSGDGKMGDMLPMMMMMNGGMFGQQQPQVQQEVKTQGCGGNCTCNQAAKGGFPDDFSN